MQQHNHWKSSQLLKKYTKIILWSFGTVLLFFDLVLKKLNIDFDIDFDIVSEIIGILSILIGFFLALLESRVWKTSIMKIPLFKNFWTPVIEGRWTGTLTRDNQLHDFVVEIKQSFTSVSCITFSKHSSSSAYAAEILYNEQLGTYKLVYYWQAKTSNAQPGTGDINTFDGFTVLDIIIEDGNVTKLAGDYFTNRQPNQTRGKISLKLEQKSLKNSFD